jgi:hypothetical protein
VIAGIVDIGDKFITSDNDTSEQLMTVTTTPVTNLKLVAMTPVNRVY